MKQIPTNHRALLDAEDRLYSRLKVRQINHRQNEMGKSQQGLAASQSAAIGSLSRIHSLDSARKSPAIRRPGDSLALFLRVGNVSLETLKIVKGLPKLESRMQDPSALDTAMPDSPEMHESDLWDLDSAFHAMQEEMALSGRVSDATEKALGEIARRFYPGISNWEPAQLTRLADRISRAAQHFCADLCSLNSVSNQAKEAGRESCRL